MTLHWQVLHMATAAPASAKTGKIESNPFTNIPDALAAPGTAAPRMLLLSLLKCCMLMAVVPAVDKVRELGHFLTGSHGQEIEKCTRTCLPACLRGGQGMSEAPQSLLLLLLSTELKSAKSAYAGAPGLGPLSMRRELIVFKDGYRTRKYCLSECTQVCALISDDQHAEMKGQR